MKKEKRTSRKKSQKVTYLLLGLAMVLLLGSAIGSTRAALTYQSANYAADVKVSQIGVSLYENDAIVSNRFYDPEEDDWTIETNRKEKGSDSVHGVLLQNLLPVKNDKKEKLVLNKEYEEKLTVKNSGSIDEYVRVRIYKYWMKDGKKVTTLSPDLIDLNLVNVGKPESGEPWIIREPEQGQPGEVSGECTELYYRGILNPKKEKAEITDNPNNPKTETEPFADTIRIDEQVASDVKIEQKGNIITTTYKYDGVEFHVDVEVDAVQTHNAESAIRSAWGVEASRLGIL